MYFFKIPTIEVQNEKYWRSKICLSAAHWDQKNHSHLSGTEKAIQHQNGIWHFTQPCDDSQHSAQHKGTQRRGAAMKIWNYIPFRNTIIPMILSTCGVIAYCCGIYCYRSARPPPCRRRQSTSVRCSRRERRCTRRLRDSERKSSSSTLPSSKIFNQFNHFYLCTGLNNIKVTQAQHLFTVLSIGQLSNSRKIPLKFCLLVSVLHIFYICFLHSLCAVEWSCWSLSWCLKLRAEDSGFIFRFIKRVLNSSKSHVLKCILKSWLRVSIPAAHVSCSFRPLECQSHDSASTTWGRSSESMCGRRLYRTGGSGLYPCP